MAAFSCPIKECNHSCDNWRDIEKHTWDVHQKMSRMCHLCQKVVVQLRLHHGDYHRSDRNCPFCADGKEFKVYHSVLPHVSAFHAGMIGNTEPLRPVTQHPPIVTLLEKMEQFFPREFYRPEFQVIVKEDYIAMFDTDKHRIVFVCKTLYPQQLNNLVCSRARPVIYSKDREVPKYDITGRKIRRARYDPGHLVPAYDCSYSLEAFNSTFNVLNVSPMTRTFNTGIWNALEFHNRKIGKKCNALTYFGIPVYDDDRPTVRIPGEIQMEIPVAYAKISFLEKPDEPISSQAFVLPHSSEKYRESFWKFRVNHQELEQRTRLQFRHVQRTWDYNPETFLCKNDKCYKSFLTNQALGAHQVACKPRTRCPKCSRVFETVEEVNAHMQEDHAAIQCNYCDQFFLFDSERKSHELIHRNEKPFMCPEPGCPFAARQQSSLKTHMRTHSGARPYPCTWPGCTYAGKTAGCLTRHVKTHTQERLHKCQFPGCTYTAIQKGTVQKHWGRWHAAHEYVPGPPLKRPKYTPAQ